MTHGSWLLALIIVTICFHILMNYGEKFIIIVAEFGWQTAMPPTCRQYLVFHVRGNCLGTFFCNVIPISALLLVQTLFIRERCSKRVFVHCPLSIELEIKKLFRYRFGT